MKAGAINNYAKTQVHPSCVGQTSRCGHPAGLYIVEGDGWLYPEVSLMAQLMVKGLPEHHIFRMSLLSILLGPNTVQTDHLNQGAGPNTSIVIHVHFFLGCKRHLINQ